ncbi:hypothetical protein ACQP00_22120 [Dactylosporangium sp. CS-047395]|uniref:hypothetical protein n=1 Tax=Dactylosporangium sp. CS-047395 TaxID=3239936 RepID=UPI003D93A5BD
MGTDEQYGVAVFRVLDGEPGASSVDVLRAIADGERRHRRVRLAGSAGVATAVLGVLAAGWLLPTGWRGPATPQTADSISAPPSAPPSAAAHLVCRAAQLPTPPGQPPKGVVSGADPSGRYLVGRTYPDNDHPSPVIWVDGTPHPVAIPGDDPGLVDVNASGTAVGISLVHDAFTSWVYTGGVVTQLKGGPAQVAAIDEHGTMVGSTAAGAVRWDSLGADPVPLPSPVPGWKTTARDIDQDGTILGTASRGAYENVAVLWHPDGRVETLPAPTGYGATSTDYRGTAIRGGYVLGKALYDWPGGKRFDGVVWNLRTGTVTSTPGLFNAVNGTGWIAGSSGLVIAPGKVALPGLSPADDARSTEVYTLSDDGTRLAGQVGGTPLPVVWTCTAG